MPRPAVDIVVPFVGSDEALAKLIASFEVLGLGPDDTFTVVDNRATSEATDRPLGHAVVRGAPAQQSSYYARNRGAERGTNPWLVFLDADVLPDADLLEQYFAVLPGEGVGILIGGIYDAPPDPVNPTAVEQYAARRGAVGHETTLRADGFSFAQTANAAVRRTAFDAVGGFVEGVRSGGDADLCFRIKNAGFAMEPRFEARVEHANRTSVKAFARVYARYGSGAAWVNQQHPGYSPRPNPARVVLQLGASVARTALALLRGRRAEAQVYALDGVQRLAMTAGRVVSNRVP